MYSLLVVFTLTAAPECTAPVRDALLDVGPCDKKPAAACITAGDALIAVPGCRDVALARYDTGCTRGALRACSKLGFRLIEDSHDPRRVKRAIELFTKACDGNDALGCSNLATFTWDGEGVPRDPKKAAQYAEKACTAQDAFACGLLGSLWGQGELGAKDPVKAAGYFERACTGGSASGCNQLGIAQWEGLGVKKNAEAALKTWAQACHDRDASACLNFGRAAESRGDTTAARSALKRACTLGEASACKNQPLPEPELVE